MKRLAWLLSGLVVFAACGGGDGTSSTFSSGGGGSLADTSSSGPNTASSTTGNGAGPTTSNGGSTTSSGGSTTVAATTSTSSGSLCGTCPAGYTCGTANNIPVCRSPNGIPLFSHVFLILMENTSLASLTNAEMTPPNPAPNLTAMASMYATGSDYHGVTHPSLPNYIALTSGDTQGIACDGDADPTETACSSNSVLCEADSLLGCSESNNAMNIADQLEAAGKSWMAYSEDMGTPCNITDSGNYAQRHVPFLYYQDVQGDSTRCGSHVVDYGNFSPASAADYNFIAPNLIDDMHNPSPNIPPATTNIMNGDMWIGPTVANIMASSTYTQGGLLVIVWDEDDDSGLIPTHGDDPIPIFVMSPYAKSGGFVSMVHADHYSLLATIEDGLSLPRLGNAASAMPLSDYFPAN